MKKIFINPFVKFRGIVFIKILNLVKNHGVALIFLSIIINILLLPLYYLSERIAKKEKDIQNKMKPKIDEYKSVYKGYEQHLYIKNVYRLNNYHPIYSLRGLLSLFIQIPFFIGAYNFLSTYEGFVGVSFLGIANLAKPDGILKVGNLIINLLPFLMTFFNLISGYIYTKESSKNEKITIVIIALFFLVLLYGSPSSLLIYWTFNNIFSLVKNLIVEIFNKKKNSKRGAA